MGGWDVVVRRARPTDDELRADAAFFTAFERDVWPHDPTTPADAFVAAQRAIPDGVDRADLRVVIDGAVVGSADVRIDRGLDVDPDVLRAQVRVHPDQRRRGVGTAVLGELVQLARASGQTSILARTYSTCPASEAFATAAGALRVSSAHTNHLRTREVDRGLVDGWVSEGPARAPGYELLAWDGAVPDDHVDAFVRLMDVMNDAPRDGNELRLTVEQWRDGEAAQAAAGQRRWLLVARHRSTRELVGLHDVVADEHFPTSLFITSTGVAAAHRGHALGRWMKALMTRRVLDERPDVLDIRTENDDSNDAMLAINAALGYRPLLATSTWRLAFPN